MLVVILIGGTACGPTSGSSTSGSAAVSATSTAAATTTQPGPAGASAGQSNPTGSGGAAGMGAGHLHVVHAPKLVDDDMHLSPGQCHTGAAANGQPLPDPACTPGAIDPAVTQSNIKSTICTPGYTATVRPPAADTDKWKKNSEADYGVSDDKSEYDHLVSLELGGANATSNLWPEPGTIPNPKDTVENRLHKEVCDGRITLAAAQQAIASNWTTAP
jgi:hypothetical protein